MPVHEDQREKYPKKGRCISPNKENRKIGNFHCSCIYHMVGEEKERNLKRVILDDLHIYIYENNIHA